MSHAPRWAASLASRTEADLVTATLARVLAERFGPTSVDHDTGLVSAADVTVRAGAIADQLPSGPDRVTTSDVERAVEEVVALAASPPRFASWPQAGPRLGVVVRLGNVENQGAAGWLARPIGPELGGRVLTGRLVIDAGSTWVWVGSQHLDGWGVSAESVWARADANDRARMVVVGHHHLGPDTITTLDGDEHPVGWLLNQPDELLDYLSADSSTSSDWVVALAADTLLIATPCPRPVAQATGSPRPAAQATGCLRRLIAAGLGHGSSSEPVGAMVHLSGGEDTRRSPNLSWLG